MSTKSILFQIPLLLLLSGDMFSQNAKVNGNIRSRLALDVDADVTLYRDTAVSEFVTGSYFQFTPTPGTFSLCVRRDHDHLNGISASDVAKIQRHILGIAALPNPLLLLAADVNASSSITASDIAEMRKLILGIIGRFSKVPSWVFIPADTTVPAVPNAKNYANLCKHFKVEANTLVRADYTAVKMGDVTDNARLSYFSSPTEKRMRLVYLQYQNQEIENDLVRSTFSLTKDISKDVDLTSLQFSLGFDPGEFEFIKIESEGIEIDEDQYTLHMINDGIFNFAWNDNPLDKASSSKGNLFSILWRKKTHNSSNPNLSMNSKEIEALGSDQDFNEFKLSLQKTTLNAGTNIKVYQNSRYQAIIIQAHELQNEMIQYSIIDILGNTLLQKSEKTHDGSFASVIPLDQIKTGALYFVKIQTGPTSSVLKFVKI